MKSLIEKNLLGLCIIYYPLFFAFLAISFEKKQLFQKGCINCAFYDCKTVDFCRLLTIALSVK